jgi:hypothetical protein
MRASLAMGYNDSDGGQPAAQIKDRDRLKNRLSQPSVVISIIFDFWRGSTKYGSEFCLCEPQEGLNARHLDSEK